MVQLYIILAAVIGLIGLFGRKIYQLKKELQQQILAKKEKAHKELKKVQAKENTFNKIVKNTYPDRKMLSDISHILKKTEMLMTRKSYQEAEKLYIQVLVMDHDNIEANKKLALLYLITKRDSKAEAIYRKLAEKEIADPAIFTNFGLAMYNQSKYNESIKAYQRATVLDPHRPARYINLGQVYFIVRQFEEAAEAFQKALNLDPKNTEYKFILADTYREMQEYKKVRDLYVQISESDPYNKDIQKEIALLNKTLAKA